MRFAYDAPLNSPQRQNFSGDIGEPIKIIEKITDRAALEYISENAALEYFRDLAKNRLARIRK